MKKTMKKVVALTAVSTVLMTGLVGCSNEPETLKVGVIQFGSHPSLDNCYTGILEGLEESGLQYEVVFENGNFDQAANDTIAKTMVSQKVDIMIPIATPSAISAYSAGMQDAIPVVFTAVSDPVAAGLVDSIEAPGGHATGTASVIDHDAQLDLIQALQPDITKIGVLYTTSEANSISDLAVLTEKAAERGIEIIAQGVQSAADIPQAATSLVPQVEAINNLADNNVVNNLGTVIEAANNAGIPVYGSEEEQVSNGCLASEGVDYIAVGKASAAMAVEILKGAEVSEMPVDQIADSTPFINSDVLGELGLTLPEAYADATMLTTVE